MLGLNTGVDTRAVSPFILDVGRYPSLIGWYTTPPAATSTKGILASSWTVELQVAAMRSSGSTGDMTWSPEGRPRGRKSAPTKNEFILHYNMPPLHGAGISTQLRDVAIVQCACAAHTCYVDCDTTPSNSVKDVAMQHACTGGMIFDMQQAEFITIIIISESRKKEMAIPRRIREIPVFKLDEQKNRTDEGMNVIDEVNVCENVELKDAVLGGSQDASLGHACCCKECKVGESERVFAQCKQTKECAPDKRAREKGVKWKPVCKTRAVIGYGRNGMFFENGPTPAVALNRVSPLKSTLKLSIEEANLCMIPHIFHAVNQGFQHVVVLSNNTDVFALLTHFFMYLREEVLCELWMSKSASDNIPIHTLAKNKGAIREKLLLRRWTCHVAGDGVCELCARGHAPGTLAFVFTRNWSFGSPSAAPKSVCSYYFSEDDVIPAAWCLTSLFSELRCRVSLPVTTPQCATAHAHIIRHSSLPATFPPPAIPPSMTGHIATCILLICPPLNKDSPHLNLDAGGCIWLDQITKRNTPKAASSLLHDITTWKFLQMSSATVVEKGPDPRFAPAYINPIVVCRGVKTGQRVVRFPHVCDTERFELGKRVITSPKFAHMRNEHIYKVYRIFNCHFSTDCFSLGTKRLNTNSVPTLLLPDTYKEICETKKHQYPTRLHFFRGKMKQRSTKVILQFNEKQDTYLCDRLAQLTGWA
ncbi:hypothetical protein PR048_005709 [Dryococelus australis]|uniref:Uncharacterized protein n=1 Tax=Dryococelus australis TaxID=614101 RepID=A0ABQ9I904_9NEOP|nr:hypothetical protein PR048_005709 [Dryococelus australis]